MQVDDPRVLGEPAHPPSEGALEPGAELRRAEVRLLVDHVQVGRAAEQGEEVLAVVCIDRELVRARERTATSAPLDSVTE